MYLKVSQRKLVAVTGNYEKCCIRRENRMKRLRQKDFLHRLGDNESNTTVHVIDVCQCNTSHVSAVPDKKFSIETRSLILK